MANPTPPLGQLPATQITARKIGQSSAIVTVNGARYEVTASREGVDITNQFSSQAAQEAIMIALNLVGKNAIETTRILLTGIPEDLDAAASPHARSVTLLSAIVQESPHTQGRHFSGDCIDHAIQPKINQCLWNIEHSFRSGNANPLALQGQHLQPSRAGLYFFPQGQTMTQGRLDLSILYQWMKKERGADFETTKKALDEVARGLRQSIPGVDIDSDPMTFLERMTLREEKPKFAVVDNNGITHCYPENEQVNFNDWTFIHLDNDGWKPVDMERSQEILEEWIRIKNGNIDQEDLLATHLRELYPPA